MSEKSIQRRLDKARGLVTWLNDHPMATRDEVYLTWREHGVRTEAQWYDVYPLAQHVLRDDYDGLAIVHYEHPKMVATPTGQRKDFWWVTGNDAYAREHLLRLVRHMATRANTIADDRKTVVMQRSADDATRKAASEILDMAHHVSSTKARLDLMEFGTGPKLAISDADLTLLRSWLDRTPFIPRKSA